MSGKWQHMSQALTAFLLEVCAAIWASFIRLCTKSLCYTLLCVKYIWVSFLNCTAFFFYDSGLLFVSCSPEGDLVEQKMTLNSRLSCSLHWNYRQTPPHPLSFHPCPQIYCSPDQIGFELWEQSCLSFQITEYTEMHYPWPYFLTLKFSFGARDVAQLVECLVGTQHTSHWVSGPTAA